jgi:hypothetical protein
MPENTGLYKLLWHLFVFENGFQSWAVLYARLGFLILKMEYDFGPVLYMMIGFWRQGFFQSIQKFAYTEPCHDPANVLPKPCQRPAIEVPTK